jgi:hypothetical protein
MGAIHSTPLVMRSQGVTARMLSVDLSRSADTHNLGQLPPFIRKKTQGRNDRDQGGADVARRRSRSEEIYKAAAQKVGTPAKMKCRSNVHGLRNRSGAIDPLLNCRFSP